MTPMSQWRRRYSIVIEQSRSRSVLSSPTLNAALLCVFLGAVDLTVIAAILPRMIADLGVNTSDIDRYIWIVSGYLIAYIVAIPIVGRVSDMAGRRNTFLACLAIFMAGSIVCGLSDTMNGLIVGRSIQGFGAGGLLPVALALTSDTLPRGKRFAGIGLVSAVDTLGWVIGPVYGAVVEALAWSASEGWRWIFWLNVPLLAVAAVFVVVKFPSESEPGKHSSLHGFDWLGSLLLASALVGINLALSAGGEIGSASTSGMRALGGTSNPLSSYVPLLLFISLICGGLLVIWEQRVRFPLLPVALFANRTFLLASIANFLVGAVLMVGMVDVPVVVALVANPDHATEIGAGMLATFTIGIMIMSVLSSRLIRLWGSFRIMFAGLALAAIGFALLYPLLEGGHVFRMSIGLVIAGCGLGLLIAPLSAIVLDQAVERDYGAAAGMALVFRLLGMTIGISALTALAVKRLQSLTDALDPIVRQPDEGTAVFLLRQQQFLENHAIPLSIQVVQETFLIAAALALLAMIPIWLLTRSSQTPQAIGT